MYNNKKYILDFRLINLLTLLWLSSGVILFFIGWCRWYYSVPLSCIMLYVILKSFKNDTSKGTVEIVRTKFWIACVVAVVMMAVCGIGGYVVQPNDHFGRNAIFSDTFNYSWPVYNKSENLYQCYYLAFWMVPALAGKLFNSINIGYFAQLVWISAALILLYLNICRFMGKARLSYLFFFYFFCGLKIIECLVFLPFFAHNNFLHDTILTLATNGSPQAFHAGSMVQLLYDPYNQTIPLFLGMMLIFNNCKSRMILFYYSLLLLYAPFPFAGLGPVVFVIWIENLLCIGKHKASYIFSVENITALLVLTISLLYLLSNINGSYRGWRVVDSWPVFIYGFIVYVVFEYLVYLLIGYKACRDKLVLWTAFITTCIFGWYQIGLHNDFCFRSNMPLIFILCLLVIRRYYMTETTKKIRAVIISCYVIGGLPAQIHPCLRLLSTGFIVAGQPQTVINNWQNIYDVRNMYIMQRTTTRDDGLKSTFNCGYWAWMCNSFKGSPDSFFFRYIAAKPGKWQ